jgi:hypothetical protein
MTCDESFHLVEIKTSNIPNAGRGVFNNSGRTFEVGYRTFIA